MEEQKIEKYGQSAEITEQKPKDDERQNGEPLKQYDMDEVVIRRKRNKAKFHLTGSTAVKVMAFLLMIISVVPGVAAACGCYVAAEERMYIDSKNEVIRNSLGGMARRTAYTVRDYLENGYEKAALEYLEGVNAEVAVLKSEDIYAGDSNVFLWQSYDENSGFPGSGFYSDVFQDIYMPTSFFDERNSEGEKTETEEQSEFVFRVFFDLEFPIEDDIRQTYELTMFVYEMRYMAIGVLAGSILLFILCFVFLLCAVGHKNGREGIVPNVLTNIHFDVLTVALAVLLYAAFYIVDDIAGSGMEGSICAIIFCFLSGILGMLWLMDFAVRLKLGKWWKHTLIYTVLRAVWRAVKFFGRAIWKLLSGMPLVMTTVIVYLGICILEFIGCIVFMEAEGVVLWAIEKVVLLFMVLYIALTCKRLLTASEKLAEGKEDYRVDTGYMVGAFKEHGENLNSLGQGISKAVAERMKSEHLKTELITNVSHDLKTPLTSIINYANLICEEQTDNPKIAEYSQVLLRQSGRLKKLLEDLVEASKATTGNLEVNPAPCEVGVLLTQAVGEYQQRMEEKGLELRTSQPELPVKIMADGRHLWRVFDNLLNNICKYAQENSRVYLSLEQREEKVLIIFRNMSKYALDISPEDLEERFVRGDKSRHMEGNGLGLSIAKSLTELQKGKLDICIDGDLFKVILTFDALPE